MFKNFDYYNQLWAEGKTTLPFILLIGGHIGTGKSTFARLIASYIKYTVILPTGILRSIYQSILDEKEYPEIFKHTYDLYNIDCHSVQGEKEQSLAYFQKQASIVQAGVEKIITFVITEKQNFIIEGNHITPSFVARIIKQYPILNIFLKVSGRGQYKRMISAPTHFRQLNKAQMKIAFYLHDFLASEAEKYNLPIFEYKETKKVLSSVNKQLGELLTKKNGKTH